MTKPTVGRIVHYYSGAHVQNPSAAIIVDVKDDSWVSLLVFRKSGATEFSSDVEFAPGTATRRWEWPPKDEEPSGAYGWNGIGAIG
jgi:hypothetical protein